MPVDIQKYLADLNVFYELLYEKMPRAYGSQSF